jgi:hypothetical protein
MGHNFLPSIVAEGCGPSHFADTKDCLPSLVLKSHKPQHLLITILFFSNSNNFFGATKHVLNRTMQKPGCVRPSLGLPLDSRTWDPHLHISTPSRRCHGVG